MIEVLVTNKKREADNIFSFELCRPDNSDLPAFAPGAHIDVHLPNGLVRQYSLCNHPSESWRYLISVLKAPASRGGSIALHNQVAEGDRLQISEPRNLFPLSEKAEHSLLIGGGIGVTPLLCMAKVLARASKDFDIHYCARSERAMAFMQELALSDFAHRVYFHFDDGAPEQQFDVDRTLADPSPGTHLYVCGPGGFLNQVLERALALGWPGEQLHREYFSPISVSQVDEGSFESKSTSRQEKLYGKNQEYRLLKLRGKFLGSK
jgi:vanillate O-demethylase ferredoxin subunit